MAWGTRFAAARTTLTGVDPGLERLRFAGVAVLAMALAVAAMTVVRATTGEPVTVVLIAAVLAMISNLAVNEPTLPRLRATTALMAPPALAAVAAGTLLAPYRLLADAVFVAVMVGAVLIRRSGPRGTALGMASVMGFFFTQFLQASVTQLPSLLLAAALGIGSTLLLRGWLLAESPRRTVDRMLRAFHAHVHGVVAATGTLLATDPDDTARRLQASRARQTRMNATALLVAERLDRLPDDPDDAARLELRLLDTELAAERLAVTARRLVSGADGPSTEQRRALRAGLRDLAAATATRTPVDRRRELLDAARRSVTPLVAETDGLGDRAQRVAFAVARLADALDPDATSTVPAHPGSPDLPEPAPDPQPAAAPTGPTTTTRQAAQVGVATTLAIIGGELVSPARWYWAVLTAFVVFTGTTSRGDVLARGSQRLVGTIAGVAAGMALAVLVTGHELLALGLLLACVFLALYLVRLSQALMAFWITAVLALLYGLIGQFSVETLLLRVAETAVGAVAGMLAGFLVLPVRTRQAFGEALDAAVAAADAVLAAATAHLLGRPAPGTVELARDMDDALATLWQRGRPLDSRLTWLRSSTRSSYHRTVRVLGAVDHYTRRLVRVADGVTVPEWAPTLEPAVARVRANLAALRDLVHSEGRTGDVRSAEDVVDAAEAAAARHRDPRERAELLTVARLLRRTDQTVVGLAASLGGVREPDAAETDQRDQRPESLDA
ncbi:FUSC family protein [Pseudonocardia sp. CA-107938]|uniref:FUSC family protein n=1 Tax=Pseudonocardia sp. CA-107938 TaxID=3240021 RepID=UPI003D8D9FBD